MKLQRAQGGIISQDTPVEIGFNLQSGEQEGVLVEQIEISMGESGAASGQLTVETEGGKKPFLSWTADWRAFPGCRVNHPARAQALWWCILENRWP